MIHAFLFLRYFISIFPNLCAMHGWHAPWIRQPWKLGAVRSHRDFRVRRSVVHRALNCLVTHNQYYCSNHVHIDVNALEQLPHDGNLSQLTTITVESASTEHSCNWSSQTPTPLQLLKIHIVPTFHSVLFPSRSMTEQETLHQSVQE